MLLCNQTECFAQRWTFSQVSYRLKMVAFGRIIISHYQTLRMALIYYLHGGWIPLFSSRKNLLHVCQSTHEWAEAPALLTVVHEIRVQMQWCIYRIHRNTTTTIYYWGSIYYTTLFHGNPLNSTMIDILFVSIASYHRNIGVLHVPTKKKQLVEAQRYQTRWNPSAHKCSE